VAIRLDPGTVRENNLGPTAFVGPPAHGVNRLTRMLDHPVLDGLSAVGPKDPDQAHRLTGH
jgi:hypothetical protein